jgi:hypothetical protein
VCRPDTEQRRQRPGAQVPADEEVNGVFVRVAADGAVNDADATECRPDLLNLPYISGPAQIVHCVAKKKFRGFH